MKRLNGVYGQMAPRALDLYREIAKRGIDPVIGGVAEQASTDMTFRCPAVTVALWHAATGQRVYQYEFSRVPPGRERVGHSRELENVFGFSGPNSFYDTNPDASDVSRVDDVDRAMSDRVQRYWTNFARTDDPNGSGLPPSRRFDGASRRYVEITSEGAPTRQNMRADVCGLFTEARNVGGR